MSWKNSRGGTDIFVLLVVILGAFFIAGGQMIFQKSTPETPQAGGANSGSTTPTPTSATADQSQIIEIITNLCDNTIHRGNITVAFHGTEKGYFSFGLKEAGAHQYTYEFSPVTLDHQELHVENVDGFNTKPWQIQLFSGGTKNGDVFSGGTSVASKDMQPTGCK